MATLRPPSVCVLNRAQQAFGLEQKVASFRESFLKDKPEIVLWEVWSNDSAHYQIVGNTAYNVRNVRVDRDGWPDAFGLPLPLSHLLLRWTRFYEALTARFVPRVDSHGDSELLPEAFARDVLPLARAAGSTVVIVTAVELDQSFDSAPAEFETSAQALADREGLAWVSLRELLADKRVEDVRADTCCHFSDQGNGLIAQRLAPLLWRLHDDPSIKGNLLVGIDR